MRFIKSEHVFNVTTRYLLDTGEFMGVGRALRCPVVEIKLIGAIKPRNSAEDFINSPQRSTPLNPAMANDRFINY